jgi:hypothetical protein
MRENAVHEDDGISARFLSEESRDGLRPAAISQVFELSTKEFDQWRLHVPI